MREIPICSESCISYCCLGKFSLSVQFPSLYKSTSVGCKSCCPWKLFYISDGMEYVSWSIKNHTCLSAMVRYLIKWSLSYPVAKVPAGGQGELICTPIKLGCCILTALLTYCDKVHLYCSCFLSIQLLKYLWKRGKKTV